MFIFIPSNGGVIPEKNMHTRSVQFTQNTKNIFFHFPLVVYINTDSSGSIC